MYLKMESGCFWTELFIGHFSIYLWNAFFPICIIYVCFIWRVSTLNFICGIRRSKRNPKEKLTALEDLIQQDSAFQGLHSGELWRKQTRPPAPTVSASRVPAAEPGAAVQWEFQWLHSRLAVGTRFKNPDFYLLSICFVYSPNLTNADRNYQGK